MSIASGSYDVVVIGAGHNGLAAALLLAKAGRKVLVMERSEAPGGQAGTFEFAPGYFASLRAFDCGWIPPFVLSALRIRAPVMVPAASALCVRRSPGPLRGNILCLPTDAGASASSIARDSPADASRWLAFTGLLRANVPVLESLYQTAPPLLDSLEAGDVLPHLRALLSLRMHGKQAVAELLRTLPLSIRDLVDEYFTWEPLRAAICAGGVQGIAQGPYSGGTNFVLLHHLVGSRPGSIRARGMFGEGPDAFARQLDAAGRAQGVALACGTEVSRIEVDDGGVRSVLLGNGESIATRHVLSTADPRTTLHGMIEPAWLEPEVRRETGNIRMRGCTALVCYGLSNLPAANAEVTSAMQGVLSLSSNVAGVERAYDALKYRMFAESPHIEVTMPTLQWPHLAPPGRHVLMARVHYVPAEESAGAVGSACDAALEEALPGLADRAVHRSVFLPRDLGRKFGVADAGLSHGELALDQVLFMRPLPSMSRYRTPFRGLYLGGSGCHPGPMVNGAAGVLAARALLRVTA